MNLYPIPELSALQSPTGIVRIPPEIDVPVTPRIMRLIDSAAFRRLANISQLGLVAHVYPGATHSRFEHSLGVYRNGLLFLQRLGSLPEFRQVVSEEDAELLIVGGLLHDLGHWPFCHPIEDMRLSFIPRHEEQARQILLNSEIAKLLDRDWSISVDSISELLAPRQKFSNNEHRNTSLPSPSLSSASDRCEETPFDARAKYPLLGSILSGPVDIDKLDYLDRDSLHAGVPYGRNFDRNRLISQLCLGPDGRSLAITDKARTAAEMMVFARYVMFSEVYWHHAVRSATSMLQRSIWELLKDIDSSSSAAIGPSTRSMDNSGLFSEWQVDGEPAFIAKLLNISRGTIVAPLVEGLFGPKRVLYKRLAEFHCLQSPQLHSLLARRPYPELVEIAARLAERLSAESRVCILPTELLIDAPPVKLEVQFNLQVRQDSGDFLSLGELSPVAKTLANQQFDSLVKRVRIFVAPHLRDSLRSIDLEKLVARVLQ